MSKTTKTIYRAVPGDSDNGWMTMPQMAKVLGSTTPNVCQVTNGALRKIAKHVLKEFGSDVDPRQMAASEEFQVLVAQALKERAVTKGGGNDT